MPVRPTDTPLPQRYRTIRRLGRGGMATVFLAEDQRLGRRVAVKRLHADSPADVARRFEREAKVGASLNHPNVVTVYDTTIDDEGVLIVMEYVEGETLADALSRGRLEPDRATEVVCAVAAALDHAHSNGVVHRDVKPANVLLGSVGAVKLVDLGIASATESTRLTASGTVLGTPSYMAPEQLEGRGFGDAVDVYSLAAVAFEVLSGRKARQGDTPLEIAHRVVTEAPPDLRDSWPEAPPAAADLLRRGLAHDPGERPGTAGELAADLSSAIANRPEPVAADPTVRMAPTVPASPPPRARPAPPPRPARPSAQRAGPRRWPWLLAGAASLIALVALAAVLTVGGGDPTAPTSGNAQQADRGSSGRGGGRQTAEALPAPPEPEAAPEPVGSSELPASDNPDPARGQSLNDEGFALLEAGRPEEALPKLEAAVAAFPKESEDVEYAYALFNYAQASRMTGDPEAAIPALERRLEFSSDRTDVVRRELELARQAAGE